MGQTIELATVRRWFMEGHMCIFLTDKPHSGKPLQTRFWYSWQWAMSFSLFVYRCGVSDGCDASVVLNLIRLKLISLPVCCKTSLALKIHND